MWCFCGAVSPSSGAMQDSDHSPALQRDARPCLSHPRAAETFPCLVLWGRDHTVTAPLPPNPGHKWEKPARPHRHWREGVARNQAGSQAPGNPCSGAWLRGVCVCVCVRVRVCMDPVEVA